jgi:hypothetical protein
MSNFPHREKAASIIVRARQVIPALSANELATLGLQALGTNRAVTDRVLRRALSLGEVLRICLLGLFHGPKVIAQPG